MNVYGRVAQMVRAFGSHPKGHRFKSCHAHHALMLILFSLLFSHTSCASYRVVEVARGIDAEGNVRQFYAVAHNNVIIPEYVINERGEYPTDEKTAWERFHERKDELLPRMKAKYRIPSDTAHSMKQTALGTAFTAVLPITYPVYAMASGDGQRSPADYYDLMVNGPSARTPELKDEFENF